MLKFYASASAVLISLLPGHAFALEKANVERIDAASVKVSWSDADPVSIYIADQADTPLAKAKLVAENVRTRAITLPLENAHRRYVLLRDKGDGTVTRVAERLFPLEQGSNFRDIGGYSAAAGKRVRWGLIYRSGGTPLLSPADQERVRGLGLANMVDLRSDEERVLAPSRIDGVPYSAIGYTMGDLKAGNGMETVYRGFPTMLAPQLRMIFAKLLRKEGPLAYNCSAGQDRTGFATAILLAALGTPRDEILADYHLSTTYRHPEFEMPKIGAEAASASPIAGMFAVYQKMPNQSPQPLKTAEGKAFLSFALEEVEAKWGSIDNYLKAELGVGPAEVRQLRAIYTE